MGIPLRAVAVAAVLAGVCGAVARLALREEAPGVGPQSLSAVAEGSAVTLGLEEVDLARMPDGEPFPAGSRRDGRRRIVIPDGRGFVRARGSSEWRPEARPQTRRPPVRPDARGLAKKREFVRGFTDAAELGRLFSVDRPENVRPPTWVSEGAVTPGGDMPDVVGGPEAGRPGEAFPEPDALFTHSGDRRPRLDVLRVPEAGRRRRRPAEDRRALEEERAVVAQHGLRADYYDFLEGRLHAIPDLATLPPTFTRIDLQIDFSKDEQFKLPFPPETFAALWRGYLVVPETGAYTFTCGSDDGARLTIGETVVIDHETLRPYGETVGTVELESGRHPLEIVFYENEIFASCRLFWAGPSWSKRIVESRFFEPPDEVAGVIQPHVTRIEPATARVGEIVTIVGVGYADIAELNRVTFAGVSAEVLEAAADTLRVEVPVGASSGDVVVQVGPLSSLPRRFEVDSVNGLYAEYYLLGTELDEFPDYDREAPFFVRLDGPLDFHQDELWNLPSEPDVFASRHTGYLYFPEEGDYRITVGSDDGMRLSIDGQMYVERPGLHPYREDTRTSRFTKGFHPIELIFYENRGGARLRLFWQRPHEPTRSVVPRGFLFPPEEVVDGPAPRLDRGSIAGGIGAEIEITGTNFGDDPRLVRVGFPGGVWSRPTVVEDGRLVTRVPLGAGPGELRVAIGVRSSNAAPFERTTPIGLTAEYFVFSSEEELRKHATPEALGGRDPNLTRIDTLFDRRNEEDWDLPFPARNFAVHWSGTLGSEFPTRVGWMLQADAGALLLVDGHVAVHCGPFHTLLERGGSSRLSAGEHDIDLYYFQADGEAKLRWFWNPYGLAEHRDVPARWFRPAGGQ